VTCLDPVEKGSTTHSRGLSLVLGSIVEDPATGSASGNLGAYLAHHGLLAPKGGRISFINEQGYEIGRPSKISVDVGVTEGQVESVRVGGTVVRMMDGTAYL
jgi:trans-2,3-dihydro-3-hydroxyanthranilate isomerase